MQHMEEKWESYEHRYRLLEEHIREAVVAADLNLTITYCSPSIERLIGKAPADLEGTSLRKYLSLSSLNAIRIIAEKLPGDVKEKTLTLELRRASGEFFPVSTRLFVRPNTDPTIVVVLRDEHPLYDQILYEAIEKCRLVFETSEEAMFVVNKHGRLTDVNSTWGEAFLYSREDVAGLKLRLFFPKELEDLLVYNIQKPVISWEGDLATKNGDQLRCRVQAALWKGKDGEVLGHIARVWNTDCQD